MLAIDTLKTTVRQLCEGDCLRNWKIGFAAILLFEGLLFPHFVYVVKRATVTSNRRFNMAFHLGNAVSAGVFLAAGLLHVLPEAVSLMSGEGHGDEHADEHSGESAAAHFIVRQKTAEAEEHSSFPWAFLIAALSFYLIFFIEQILLPKILPSGHKHGSVEEARKEVSAGNSDDLEIAEEAVPVTNQSILSRAFVQGLVEVVGLSAHSFFESMALGLSSSLESVLNIFIATAAHRWATSMALAFKLVKQLNYVPFLLLIILFSAAVPIGIGVGAALTSLPERLQGVLFSISAGTFIYIGVFELMADEFVSHQEWKLRKFLCTCAGAGVIIIITAVLTAAGVHG